MKNHRRRAFAASLPIALTLATGLGQAAHADGVARAEVPTCNGLPATIVGSPGTRVRGTEGDDVIVAASVLSVEALGGDDTICVGDETGGGSSSYIYDGPGDDFIDASRSTQRIGLFRLGDGDDTVIGSPFQDNFEVGRTGNSPDDGHDVINAGLGDDRVGTGGTEGNNVVNDEINLGSDGGILRVFGDLGPDASFSGGGADGPGRHQLTFGASGSWTVDALQGELLEEGSTPTPATGFDFFELGIPFLTFKGSDAAEQLYNAGQTIASMGGGDDTIAGDLTDFEKLDGGPGVDSIGFGPQFPAPDVRVRADLAKRRITITGAINRVIPLNDIENISASMNDLTLVGDDEANVLRAGNYGDCGSVVAGGAGRDKIFVTNKENCARVTRIAGGAGNDQINGMGTDILITGDAGNDRLDGDSGDVTLRGGPGNDHLLGGAFVDRLFGGQGNDTMAGAERGDHLNGGPGRDLARGQEGNDTCVAEVVRTCEK
jgi:Ca2+-binding RTX toxin-like protein